MRNEIYQRVQRSFPELNILQVGDVTDKIVNLLIDSSTIEAPKVMEVISSMLEKWEQMRIVPVSEISEIAEQFNVSRNLVSKYIFGGLNQTHLVRPPKSVRLGDKVVRCFVIYKK